MDLQTAARAKGLLDEINKLENELKRFEPELEFFNIHFVSKIPMPNSGSSFNFPISQSLNQDEFDNVIQYIKNIIGNKITKLKKELDEL